jgi:rare lipoprotein A
MQFAIDCGPYRTITTRHTLPASDGTRRSSPPSFTTSYVPLFEPFHQIAIFNHCVFKTIDELPMLGKHTAGFVLSAALLMMLGTSLPAQSNFTQTGVASFYGKKFHGRTTANGERYSMWAMTAAHKSIPFDSRVRVTNLKNNKSVVVRINDHGPHVKGRIIDLSRGAAAKIDMIKSGTARVKVEVLSSSGKRDDEKSKGNVEYFTVNIVQTELSGWGIQVASFEKMENLIRHADRLRERGVENVHIQMATVRGQRVHRIVVGGYESEDAAKWKLKKLKDAGIDGFVFRIP